MAAPILMCLVTAFAAIATAVDHHANIDEAGTLFIGTPHSLHRKVHHKGHHVTDKLKKNGGMQVTIMESADVVDAAKSLMRRNTKKKGKAACQPGGSPGDVLETGCYELNGRTYHVFVPQGGSSKKPVLVSLHGSGGDGNLQLGATKKSNVAPSHIIVAPDGEENSWNVVAEDSSADDKTFIARDLVNSLAQKSNVERHFTLYGHSNGAAMTNSILIEGMNPKIKAAITDKSQLNTNQWHNKNFYAKGADNSYSAVQTSLRPRRLLQLTGEDDSTIPSDDVSKDSKIPGLDGAKVRFLPWKKSAFEYAEAYGFTGDKPPSAVEGQDYTSLSFPDQGVKAYNFKDDGHGLSIMNTVAKPLVEQFIAEWTDDL